MNNSLFFPNWCLGTFNGHVSMLNLDLVAAGPAEFVNSDGLEYVKLSHPMLEHPVLLQKSESLLMIRLNQL